MAEDLLAKLFKENQLTGLGTASLSDSYFSPQSKPAVGNIQPDTSGLGYITTNPVAPALSDDYFKMQMYKPGETEQKDIFMGMNPTEWSSAMKVGQLGLGGANLGLGVLSYFNQKDLAEKQKEVLGQQIESNAADIAARKNYRSALEKF